MSATIAGSRAFTAAFYHARVWRRRSSRAGRASSAPPGQGARPPGGRAAAAGPRRERHRAARRDRVGAGHRRRHRPRSVRKAMEGVERVFHVAGTTSMRPRDRDRVFEVNVGGTRNVMEEALRAGVERVVHTSTRRGRRRASRARPTDEDQPFTAARLGIAYINSKHEAESRRCGSRRKGLPVVVVNPTFVLGPDDPDRDLQRADPPVPAAPDPRLRRRRAQRRRRPRRRRRAICSPTSAGEVGERYLLGGRNFTLQRLFADLGRIAGVPPPPVEDAGRRLALAAVEAMERLGAAGLPTSRDEVRSGIAVVDLPQRQGARGSSASSRARTRRRWRTRSAGSSSSSASGSGGHRADRRSPCVATGAALLRCFGRWWAADEPSGREGDRRALPLPDPDELPLPLRRRRPAAKARARVPDRARPLPAQRTAPRSSS